MKPKHLISIIVIVGVVLLIKYVLPSVIFPDQRMRTYFIEGSWDVKGEKFSYGVHTQKWIVGRVCIDSCIEQRVSDTYEIYTYNATSNRNEKVFTVDGGWKKYEFANVGWSSADDMIILKQFSSDEPLSNGITGRKTECSQYNITSKISKTLTAADFDCVSRGVAVLSTAVVGVSPVNKNMLYRITPGWGNDTVIFDNGSGNGKSAKLIASVETVSQGAATYVQKVIIETEPTQELPLTGFEPRE